MSRASTILLMRNRRLRSLPASKQATPGPTYLHKKVGKVLRNYGVFMRSLFAIDCKIGVCRGVGHPCVRGKAAPKRGKSTVFATAQQLQLRNLLDNLVSRQDKLYARLSKKPPPKDFRWEELLTLARQFGFTESCNGGSHYVFQHSSGFTFVASKTHPSGLLKPYQIKDALEALNKVSSS